MFSQTTEYALRAMACLALYGQDLVSTSDLASMTKVPSNYLAKVLQQLAAEELITGRRGVGGGYRLARGSGEINLLDIINAVSSLRRIESCPLGIGSHGPNLCPLHRTMDRAAKAIIEIFDGVTLKDLVDDAGCANQPMCDAARAARVSVVGSLTIKGAAPR